MKNNILIKRKLCLVIIMAGAMFAMAIIVIAYLFNDTVMLPEDIEKKIGLNVLGTLPLEEAEYDGEKTKPKKQKKQKRKGS